MATPSHLEPSKLGTKEYWDALYTKELANHAHDASDTGTAWFDDSDAEAKLVAFLDDEATNLGLDLKNTTFLDLGTGNGALLFALRDAGWTGHMVGVDYSAQSVRFAKRIERDEEKDRDNDIGKGGEGSYQEPEKEDDDDEGGEGGEYYYEGPEKEDDSEDEERKVAEKVDVHFYQHDILHDSPAWIVCDARLAPPGRGAGHGFDVVLDKGTFDAISLSDETLPTSTSTSTSTSTTTSLSEDHAEADITTTTSPKRVHEAYGSRILPLVCEGGLFLITSCNWTEAELRAWFEDGAVQKVRNHVLSFGPNPWLPFRNREEEEEEEIWGFEVVGRVAYRSFSFGGVKGQTISSLCFRKVRKTKGGGAGESISTSQ
ncbi:hypothetical protein F4777DRAFT_360265 [Nemania sp. FL0916]|nr:hypothetical protein F4777DRAFT_360265 [Nemania sp. FL0916]